MSRAPDQPRVLIEVNDAYRRLTAVLLVCSVAGVWSCARPGDDQDARPDGWFAPDTVSVSLVHSFGGIGGQDSTVVFGVTGAVRLSDGSVAIANSGTLEVLAFAADGSLAWRAGRSGDGPGEFRSIASIGVARGDTIFVHDPLGGRVTVMDGDGHHVRTMSLPVAVSLSMDGIGTTTFLQRMSVLATGSLAFSHSPSTSYLSSLPDGTHTVPTPVSVYDSRGILVSGPRLLADGTEWSLEDGTSTHVPFGALPSHSAAADRVVYGSGKGSVHLLSPDLEPVASLSVEAPPLSPAGKPVTAELGERALDRLAQMRGGNREGSPALPPIADEVPDYRRVLGTPEGSIWVMEFVPFRGDAETWWILDDTGAIAKVVTLPAGRELLAAGPDHLVTLQRDSLGVETVELWRMERPIRGPVPSRAGGQVSIDPPRGLQIVEERPVPHRIQ